MPLINRPASSQTRPAPPVRKAFDQWTLSDAKNAVAYIIDRRVGKDGFAANWAYAQDHDHLQNGEGWIGPQGGDETVSRSKVKSAVARQFTPVDATAEVLDNLANALLQNKAQVMLEAITPAEKGSDAEERQQEEAKKWLDILLRWAEDRKLWMKAREAVKRSRWATWGTLRAWIPESAIAPAVQAVEAQRPGIVGRITQAVTRAVTGPTEEPDKAEQQTTLPLPTGLDLEDALNRIFLSAPAPDQGFVYVDPDSQKRVGIFLYVDDRDEYVELCWVGDQGETVLKMLSQKGDNDEVSHDLGRRLLVNQMEAELLITEPVRMQQAQLNFAQTILTRVMETAGFAERYVLDAMPEGELTDVPPTNVPAIMVSTDDTGKKWYLVPKDRTIGAGVSTDLRGMIDTDADGKEHARTPNVIFKEPTDPDYIVRAARAARGTLLRQCKQGHLEMDDQATASGWSRVQARAAHLADVANMREPLIQLLKQTLDAVLAYAALMSEDARRVLETYRVSVQVHINLGPVSPEERTAILEMLKAGALSLPTALTMLQIDDVSGEIERIRSQPESQRATLKEQAEIGGMLISQWGLDVVTVAELVGLPKEMILLIKKADAMLQQQPAVDAQGNPLDAQGNPIPRNGNPPPPQNQPPVKRGAAA